MSIHHTNTHTLLDHLIGAYKLKNDAAIARTLDVGPPVISKIRNRILPVSDGMILRIHERMGVSVPKIRALIAKD